jgi:hypothetical protein
VNVLKGLAITLTVACTVASTSAFASNVTEDLSFTSQDQSMWGPGSATQFDYNQFIGPTWSKSVSEGGFVGGDTQITNPAWTAWNLCPFHCGLPEPTHYFDVNTTTGVQASATTTGKVGFNLGFTMDSGSLNSLAHYQTQVDLPTTVSAGQLVSLNTSGGNKMTGGSLNSQFPTLSASLSLDVEVSASFAATGCLTGSCISKSFSTGTIGGVQPLVSFDNGGITWFGGSGTMYDILNTAANLHGTPLPTGLPATFDIPAPGGFSSLGSVTVNYPQPNVSGTLNSAGTAITGTASGNTLDFSADVDNLIATGLGVPGLFGGNVDLGAGFGIDYNLISVNMGPTISLTQTFDLTPTLYVDLAFSQPVDVTGYGMVSQINGLDWNNLPTMAFGNGDTTITPTFYLGTDLGGTFTQNAVDLLNQLALDIGGNINVGLLDATFNTPFGDESLGIGTLLDQSFGLFTTPPVFNKQFALGGFNPILGDSLTISAARTVPEPGTLALLVGGFLALVVLRRRRTIAWAR